MIQVNPVEHNPIDKWTECDRRSGQNLRDVKVNHVDHDKYFKVLKVFRLGLCLSGALIASYNVFSGRLGLDPDAY